MASPEAAPVVVCISITRMYPQSRFFLILKIGPQIYVTSRNLHRFNNNFHQDLTQKSAILHLQASASQHLFSASFLKYSLLLISLFLLNFFFISQKNRHSSLNSNLDCVVRIRSSQRFNQSFHHNLTLQSAILHQRASASQHLLSSFFLIIYPSYLSSRLFFSFLRQTDILP